MLVRTWNVFHGNAVPPERHAFLETAVRLVTADAPDVVCLQELPLWSLPRLEAWSGMTAIGDVAAPARLGPFPSTPGIGRVLTDLNHGLLRSAFTGQGNGILLATAFRVIEHRVAVLNPQRLRLPWEKERRVCQVIRVVRQDVTFVLANTHVTGSRDKRIPDRELLRAATFVDGFAEPGEPVVLAGDFNLAVTNSTVLRDLVGDADWGFAGATPQGIDHILVRGLPATPPVRWAHDRRRVDGRLLSDHTPVERDVG